MKYFKIFILWLVIIRMASKSIACVKCANLTFSRCEKVSCRCFFESANSLSVLNFAFNSVWVSVCAYFLYVFIVISFEMHIIQILNRPTIMIIKNVNKKENKEKRRKNWKADKMDKIRSMFSAWRPSEPQQIVLANDNVIVLSCSQFSIRFLFNFQYNFSINHRGRSFSPRYNSIYNCTLYTVTTASHTKRDNK